MSLLYADPFRAGRHPFQTYLLLLCVLAGVPVLFGIAPEQHTPVTLLPAWEERAWGLSLTLGALTALVGSYLPVRYFATALTVERIGLLLCGSAGVVYALLVAIHTEGQRLAAAAIILGFGLASLRRAHDIGAVMKYALTSSTISE